MPSNISKILLQAVQKRYARRSTFRGLAFTLFNIASLFFFWVCLTAFSIFLTLAGTQVSTIDFGLAFFLMEYWWANDLVIERIPEKSVMILSADEASIMSKRLSAVSLNARSGDSVSYRTTVFSVTLFIQTTKASTYVYCPGNIKNMLPLLWFA